MSFETMPEAGRVVEAMTATLARRGPDASGVWADDLAVLGHRRLAVIDAAGGAQPMTADTADGAVALTYSGETYNFVELRSELVARGHRFCTASDTEVVLRGYLEWGEAVAEWLRGMYAFAVWDARDQRLALVRDRLGVKPLYYLRLGSGLVFASEPKAILAHPAVDPILDLDGLRELFTFSRTPGHAVWAGLREVRPGSVLSLDRSGLRERTYWQLTATEHTDDLDTTVARVGELLEASVTEQLVSDVPRCALLSGGLDSTAVTALAARQERVRSYAVDLADRAGTFTPTSTRATPDGPFAQEAAEHLGTAHRFLHQDPAELADPRLRGAVVAAQDLPVGMGDIDRSLYLLFRDIRAESTVALSGEAADELFGGYKWFHNDQARQATQVPPWIAGGRGRWPHTAPFLHPDLAAALDGWTYLGDRYAEALAHVPHTITAPASDAERLERRMREISYLHLTQFVGMMLDRKDRISMAVGLEVRVPYCDHRLVEYVFNTPWAMKAFDGREKSLLRAAVRDMLPTSVLSRTKSHYPSTQDRRYDAAIREQTRELLAVPNHPVFDIFGRSRIDHATRQAITPSVRVAVERLLDTAAWLDQHRPVIKTT